MTVVADTLVPVLCVVGAYLLGRQAGKGAKREPTPEHVMGAIVGELLTDVRHNRAFVGTNGGLLVSAERRFKFEDGKTLALKVEEVA